MPKIGREFSAFNRSYQAQGTFQQDDSPTYRSMFGCDSGIFDTDVENID